MLSVMGDRSVGGHTSRPDFERKIGETATVDVYHKFHVKPAHLIHMLAK